jgi:hypothetical protein
MVPSVAINAISNFGFDSGVFSSLAVNPPGAVATKQIEDEDTEVNTKIELFEINHNEDSMKTKFIQLLKFMGPALMVSVGYVDPGNWETDIQGGSTFGYKLLYVLVFSNWLAILLQTLAARMGLVTGKNLAEVCTSTYHAHTNSKREIFIPTSSTFSCGCYAR